MRTLWTLGTCIALCILETSIRSASAFTLHGSSLSLIAHKKSSTNTHEAIANNLKDDNDDQIGSDDDTDDTEDDEAGDVNTDDVSVTSPDVEESQGGGGGMGGIQIAVSLISLVGQQFVTKINFKNRNIHKLCRIVFVAYLLLSQALVWFLRRQIEETDDQSVVDKGAGSPMGSISQLARNLPGFDMVKSMIPDTNKAESSTLTAKEYDLQEANKISYTLITEAIMTLYMDVLARMPYLLLVIPLAGITNKIKSPLVQIHVFGKRATGALSRPFRSAFESAMQRQATQGAVEEVVVSEATSADAEVEMEDQESVEVETSGSEDGAAEEDDIEEENEEDDDEDGIDLAVDGSDLTDSWPSLSAIAEEEEADSYVIAAEDEEGEDENDTN